MLAAGSGGTVGVDADVLRIDHHRVLVRRLELGHHLDQGERRVAPVVLIKGGDAHEPVHPVLGSQQPIRARPTDDEGGALQSGLLAW